ncbi:MAG TPA: CHAD domain-containing protein [Thermoanaerobaculia bacterium]
MMVPGYEFRSGEKPFATLGRIVAENMNATAVHLRDRSVNASDRVHETRKRFKEIRALLRLFHEPLGDQFAIENRWYRDAGRALAGYRDVDAVIASISNLSPKVREQVGSAMVRKLRRVTQQKRREVYRDREAAEERLEGIAAQLPIAAARVNNLSPAAFKGFASIEDGLVRTLRDGKRAMRAAWKSRDAAAFHEWRKRVKDHWYHVQLLHSLWPDQLAVREKVLNDLSHILGEHHDLEVIRNIVAGASDTFTASGAKKIDRALVARQRRLEQKAKSVGEKIYSGRPAAFAREMAQQWKRWRYSPSPSLRRIRGERSQSRTAVPSLRRRTP